MKSLYTAIRNLVPALPGGDTGSSQTKTRFDIVPLTNQSVRRSAMHRELLAAHKGGEWIPRIDLLPDVGKMEINLSPFNPALLSNGIIARYSSTVTLYKNRNRKMNRYLIYMYYQLYQNRGNPTVYWDISKCLLRNSNVYLILCLHGINRNFYRELTLDRLTRILSRVQRMRGNLHESITGARTL